MTHKSARTQRSDLVRSKLVLDDLELTFPVAKHHFFTYKSYYRLNCLNMRLQGEICMSQIAALRMSMRVSERSK